jgi:hypothetical protein
MVTKIYEDKVSLGRAAAEQAAVSLRTAIPSSGRARIIAATGASHMVPFLAMILVLLLVRNTQATEWDSTSFSFRRLEQWYTLAVKLHCAD